MVNNSTNKFDDKIKDVLSNYQADFDTTDWAKMDSKLSAASASKTLNPKYIARSVIAIALIAGGYFIFNAIDWNASKPVETITPETKIETKAEPPVLKEEVVIAPVNDSASLIATDSIKEEIIIPENEKPIVAEKDKEKTEIDKTASPKPIADKNKKSKEVKNKKAKSNEDDGMKPEKVITMGNEPVFGDMLDSSRGIIRVTKEKDATKKAAKTKTDKAPVGWPTFMLENVNVDSLKNYRAKKDSIK